MLEQGTIPMSGAEAKAVEKLMVKHGSNMSLSRRDPGESGPLVVQSGNKTWHVADGKARIHRSKRG